MTFEGSQWLWGETLQHLSCSEMNDPHAFHVRVCAAAGDLLLNDKARNCLIRTFWPSISRRSAGQPPSNNITRYYCLSAARLVPAQPFCRAKSRTEVATRAIQWSNFHTQRRCTRLGMEAESLQPASARLTPLLLLGGETRRSSLPHNRGFPLSRCRGAAEWEASPESRLPSMQ